MGKCIHETAIARYILREPTNHFFSQTVVLCIVELSGHEQISGGSIFGFSCDGVGV